MAAQKVEIKVTTSGSAGSASGSSGAAVPVGAIVRKYYLDFHASAPGTTDTTIKALGSPADETLVTHTNSATDGWFHPGAQVDDESAAAVTGAYAPHVLHGGILSVDIAQCDALTDAVTAAFYLEV